MNVPLYNRDFIGRQEAIDLFYGLRTLREQQNALYIEAGGGLGKTWLLRRYIQECQAQPRPWHSSTPGVDPIIDFYELENRTIDGLRKSIVRRIGVEYFPRFTELDSERSGHDGFDSTAPDVLPLPALDRELDLLFFAELQKALREIRNYTVLFFDTFELVHNRLVGRWFLDQFLTNSVAFNYQIVFAGRPSVESLQRAMPVNVHVFHLSPFSELEAKAYFHRKWGERLAEAESAAIQVSLGKPLLLDLVVHYLQYLGPIEDLSGLDDETVERAVIGGFLNAKDIVYQVIHEMAILKRRYNQSIFDYLRAYYHEEIDYEQIKESLRKFPFVKYRSGDDSFTLHDEFQRMIIGYGGSVIKALKSELYNLVVQTWYKERIQELGDGPKRHLLLAEQSAYIVEHDWKAGLETYNSLFETIRSQMLFNLSDMVWGEVAASLNEKLQGSGPDREIALGTLAQIRAQANWLFEKSRFGSAAYWFEQALKERFAEVHRPEDLTRDKIRLGHCYLELAQVSNAALLWEAALSNSRLIKNTKMQAQFAYNLGHARVRQGRWDDALKLYDEAIKSAGKVGDLELKGEALFVLASQRARRGELDSAIHDLEHGLQIMNQFQKGQVPQALAFVHAGDVYRYDGDLEKARGYYEESQRLLDQQDKGWFKWQALARAGLGAVLNLAGLQKRERWNDIDGDVQNQEQAFEFLIDSLNLARQHQLDVQLIRILDRLADVYLELYRIEEIANEEYLSQKPRFASRLQRLRIWVDSLDLIEEQAWPNLREAGVSFRSLDLLGKAQRLFEIAFLQSDKKGEPHFMLDSLARASSVAQIRRREDDLAYYATIAYTLRGLDDPDQEILFFNTLEMIRAHIQFDQDPGSAIACYGKTGSVLAKGGTFGVFLLRRQFGEIEKRLVSLPEQQAKQNLKVLKRHWKKIPLLVSFIESVSDLLLASKKQ